MSKAVDIINAAPSFIDRAYSIVERRSERITETGCQIWMGATASIGYGSFSVDGKPLKAHRVAWEAARGPIPDGMCVCHRCDIPECVNVNHLFLGTHLDNMRDMYKKNRRRHPVGERNGSVKITRAMADAIFVDPRRQIDIARDYGIVQPHVSRIKRGVIWRTK